MDLLHDFTHIIYYSCGNWRIAPFFNHLENHHIGFSESFQQQPVTSNESRKPTNVKGAMKTRLNHDGSSGLDFNELQSSREVRRTAPCSHTPAAFPPGPGAKMSSFTPSRGPLPNSSLVPFIDPTYFYPSSQLPLSFAAPPLPPPSSLLPHVGCLEG